MSKLAEVELAQLKAAIGFFVGLLEEGTLVSRYDQGTREEIATALQLLLSKIEDLPDTTPDNLVQAVAVRAIIGASETLAKVSEGEEQELLARKMREVDAGASIQGHTLGPWEKVPGSALEYQASCSVCGGFAYVSHASTYNLLSESCKKLVPQESGSSDD
jgi:hypothetical protein